MRNIVTAAVAVAVLSGAAPAFAAKKPFQVIRPGDNDLSCEVMAEEINSLNAELLKMNEKAQKKAQGSGMGGVLGRGLLAGVANSASVMGYGIGGGNNLTAAVAGQAIAGVAQQAAASAAAQPAQPAEAAAPQVTPQQQRLERVNGIFQSKGC